LVWLWLRLSRNIGKLPAVLRTIYFLKALNVFGNVVWTDCDRPIPARSRLYRPYPAGRETGRFASAGANQIRNGDQPPLCHFCADKNGIEWANGRYFRERRQHSATDAIAAAKGGPGRPRGTLNRIQVSLAQEIVAAAADIGFLRKDGKGEPVVGCGLESRPS
jgi:hypothetical protein